MQTQTKIQLQHVDGQCDELVTDDRHQSIILIVHLC